jgi:hypothetical protein
VRLEEDFVLQLPFLLPEDNYSCDIVRGVPGGLLEFLQPLQAGLSIKNPPKKTHPKKPTLKKPTKNVFFFFFNF